MSQRAGFGLLEVIAAVMIFSIACIAAITMVAQTQSVLRSVYTYEKEISAASRFFDAVFLWSRADLDRHLGWRVQGHWRMYTERVTPTVYAVMLNDTITGAVILETEFYRPVKPTGSE